MKPHRLIFTIFLLALTTGCTPAAAPTPRVIVVTQEVLVTRELSTPTPAVLVVTPTPLPTQPPAPNVSIEPRSHEWVDFGGLCLRPDNLPSGVQVNPDPETVQAARAEIVKGLWRLVDLSGSQADLIPGFSTYERFEQGIQMGTLLRGPLIPVGKQPPRSDPWSFKQADPVELWKKAHPGVKFGGVDLRTICLEFYPPYEFEAEKKLSENPSYVHLVGGVSHAIFYLDDVLGAPRLVIKLYANPYPGQRDYKVLVGFDPANTPEQDALAANEHLGALVATLNTVLWGPMDGDGEQEFGYNPQNSDPLPVEVFQKMRVFVATP